MKKDRIAHIKERMAEDVKFGGRWSPQLSLIAIKELLAYVEDLEGVVDASRYLVERLMGAGLAQGRGVEVLMTALRELDDENP